VSATHKGQEHVFVILRADFFQGPDVPIEALVAAKEVVRSEDLAEQEVSRLNALRPDGRVRYWYSLCRLYPPGRSAGSNEPPA
jgi:hypothetical protein